MKSVISLVLGLFTFIPVLAQEYISIKFKDYHNAMVTHAVTSADNAFFISADQSGKILMYNTEDYGYEKTLKESSNFPISKLKLFRNDSILTYTQKYVIDNQKIDSLFAIRIFDAKEVYKSQIKGNVFIEQQDDVLMISSYNGYVHIIEFFDKAFQPLKKAYPKSETSIAAISKDLGYVAFVNESIGRQTSVQGHSFKNIKDAFEVDIPKDQKVYHVFFDKFTNELFSVNVSIEKDQLLIYNLTKNPSFSEPVYSAEFEMGNFLNISNAWNNDVYRIVITYNSSIGYYPMMLTKQGDSFTSERIKLEEGASNNVILNKKGKILFFDPYNENYTSVAKFREYDLKTTNISTLYPEIESNPLNATFMPKDNWMVWGEKRKNKQGVIVGEYQVKYYESGTFKNRFDKLSIDDYLEVNHKIIPSFKNNFSLNKEQGFVVFNGRYVGKNGSSVINEYFKYDFIKDKITNITQTPEFYKILDYCDQTSTLLLSRNKYYNSGYTDPQSFLLLNKNESIALSGKYKFGVISNNGQYLLTVDDKNTVKIKLLKSQKTIFTYQLSDGDYSIFKVDAQGFSVNNRYGLIDLNKCNTMNHMFLVDEDKKVNHQKTECVIIEDIAYANNTVAMIAENLGVFIKDKSIPFNSSEFPRNISLSEDASKMMLSFNSGKIKIYDTESLKEIGVMIHPDEKSHVFLDKDDNYFSNINPEAYLFVQRQNQKVQLASVDRQFFNPDEVLSLFGTPNVAYVEVLQKGIELRKNSAETLYQNIEEVTYQKDQDTMGEPNLYVLSIGVSDYKQSDYNLTFADKDALDMAFVYGVLDDKVKEDYRNKFLGNSFVLNSPKGKMQSLKKFYDVYKNVGNLYAVNPEKSKWLEHDYGNYYLWDFASGTTKQIFLPDDFEISVIGDDVVSINSNGSGFCIVTNNYEYYSYNFSDDTFSKLDLKFLNPEVNELFPLTENRWLTYTEETNYPYNYGVFNSGSSGDRNVQSQKINLNAIEYIDENGSLKQEKVDMYSSRLRAISSNGKYALITSVDNDLYYIELSKKDAKPFKLIVKDSIDYGTAFYISNDAQTFSLVNKIDLYSYSISTYSFKGELKNQFQINESNESTYVGVDFYNNIPFWIIQENALVSNNFYDNLETFKNNKSFSFKEVFVKVLTNEKASLGAIQDDLETFFSKATPNDQIMLFLAGHGVLDEDLEYHYAPYDMNFDDVSEKGLQFSRIIQSLSASPSQNKLLLMDTCHSGNTLDLSSNSKYLAEVDSDDGKRGSKSRLLKSKNEFKLSDVVSLFDDFLSTSGITIISASAGEDVAYENKSLGNGAFTSAYLQLLEQQLKAGTYVYSLTDEDLKKSISLDEEIFSEIMKEVMLKTNGKQLPDLREINKTSKLKMW